MKIIKLFLANLIFSFITVMPVFFLVIVLNIVIKPTVSDRFFLLFFLLVPLFTVYTGFSLIKLLFYSQRLHRAQFLEYESIKILNFTAGIILNILVVLIFIANINLFELFFRPSYYTAAFLLLINQGFVIFFLLKAKYSTKKIFVNIVSISLIPFIIFFYLISLQPDITPVSEEPDISDIKLIEHKVLIFCIDGLSSNILDKYIDEYDNGLFSKIARQGVYRNLETIYPSHSPVIWTTVGSGESPAEHGILGFGRYGFFYGSSAGYSVFPKYFGLSKYFYLISRSGLIKFQPNLSTHIRVPMIWDILSKSGYRLNVINYPVSLPPSEISGIFFSETEFARHFTQIMFERIYPADIKDIIEDICENLEKDGASLFNEYFLDLLKNRDIYSKRLAKQFFINDFKILNLVLEIKKRNEISYDSHIDIIYFHGLDGSSHLFYKDFFSDLEKGIKVSSTYLGNYLNFIENMLTRYIMEIDKEFTVFIISDHGFYARGLLESITDPFKPHLQGIHENAPEGVFMAFGKDIRNNESINIPSVFNIAPTLLYFFNLPVSLDFSAGVLDIFDKDNPVFEVESYRGLAREFYMKEIKIPDDDLKSGESLLKSLGYIN